MQHIHDECKRRLTISSNSYAAAANAKRKDRQFHEGDMVLVRLRPERFPPGSVSKLHARRAGPFKIVKKMGSNAYVVELPSEFGISPVFNIEDITAFKGDTSILPVPATSADGKFPTNTAPRDEIASILDHQFVSTRRGGYYKFLVQWKNRPNSESVWLQASELQRLHPHLFTTYLQYNLPESSAGNESSPSLHFQVGQGWRDATIEKVVGEVEKMKCFQISKDHRNFSFKIFT
ncbi:hypothetical protein SADUNF_Sadunf16G0107200 [Salix dunnii]|uniref:Chromo domain-containing protein n=1 Tax=Salix dunnii TaxID=1413687 RepID=A0A835JAZ2_9ROSI|nr:hypothetical protein SADUNF_Sadunf16G0107200 [Salix dunnii]